MVAHHARRLVLAYRCSSQTRRTTDTPQLDEAQVVMGLTTLGWSGPVGRLLDGPGAFEGRTRWGQLT